MAKTADIGGKRLISLDPSAWARWVTGISNLSVRDIISSEFQWISRETDVLIKATSPEQGEFLILNELQLHYNTKLPKRVTAYAALAREKFDLPVVPVLINILRPNQKEDLEIPTKYESTFMGLQARQDYRVLNLWEVDVNLVFSQPLPGLLPFVPVLAGGDDQAMVQRAVRELRQDPTLVELEPLLAFFAGFVLELPLVQQILRWDMTVLRESPWYEQILQEGKQEGSQQTRLADLLEVLEVRFMSVPDDLREQLQSQDADQLRPLHRAALTCEDLESFRQHLS